MSFLAQAADLSEMNISEDDKLSKMVHQATEEFDGVDFERAKKLVRRPVPQNYICHGCGLSGHYIGECPRMKLKKSDETIRKLKVTAGIPKTFLTYVDDINTPGVLLSSCGKLVVPKIETELKGTKDRNETVSNSGENKEKLPEEFTCHLCSDIKSDAVIMPCCKKSACYFCAVENILKYWPQKCPSCKKVGVSVTEVTPDWDLRTEILRYRTDPEYFRKHLESQQESKADVKSGTSESETCQKVDLPINESGFKNELDGVCKEFASTSGHRELKKTEQKWTHVRKQMLNGNVYGSTETKMRGCIKRKFEDSTNFATPKRFKVFDNYATSTNNPYENTYLLQQTPIQHKPNRYESYY